MTIGNENKFWHIHLNLDNVKTAKFVTEIREGGMNGYSVRFFDSNGNIAMRANFVKMYDENGNLRSTNLSRYDELFTKYGKKQVISFSD
jgi:putative heme iron utilization protein